MKKDSFYNHPYLAEFYRGMTYDLMERGFSNEMVTACYKCALANNTHLKEPLELSGLEEKMVSYLLENKK